MSSLASPFDLKLSLTEIGTATFIASSAAYLIFHRYEPHSLAALLPLLLVAPAGLGILAFQSDHSIAAVSATATSYWALLGLLTLLYRLSPFHPLAQYPGPLLHKISKLQTTRIASKGHLYQYYQKLHRQYGDVVRVGPNELSFVNVESVRGTLSNNLPKGPFYYRPGPAVPLLLSRDNETHARLRKPWTRAFSTSSLKDYDEIIVRRARELIRSLDKRTSETLDLARWFEFFAVDILGDLVFSYSFDMMRDGKDVHNTWKALSGSLKPTVICSHVPWTMDFVCSSWNPYYDPGPTQKLVQKVVAQRTTTGAMSIDVFHHLSNDEKKTDNVSVDELIIGGVFSVVSGSNTTSTLLSNIFYFLMRNPSQFARLREEIDEAFPAGEETLDNSILAHLPFLNACINETLRLLPPVASGSQRSVVRGTGGKMVGSHFVPEGSNVLVPTYALHRDPRYFSPYPESFWPDRWLEAEKRKDVDGKGQLGDNIPFNLEYGAFIPFTSGPRVCVARALVMQEMRIVTSWIIQQFDVQAAKGFDLVQWEKNLEDYYVMHKDKSSLPVQLTRRK